jgi:hypothetical protein
LEIGKLLTGIFTSKFFEQMENPTHLNIDSGHAEKCKRWPIVELLQPVHHPNASLAYFALKVGPARDLLRPFAEGSCVLVISVVALHLLCPILEHKQSW